MDNIFIIIDIIKCLFIVFGCIILFYNNAFYDRNIVKVPKFEKIFSFSLVLKMKMKYYTENSVIYFKLYMNCILPYIVFVLSSNTLKYILHNEFSTIIIITIVINIIVIVVLLINILLIRYVDKLAFIFNKITLIIILLAPMIKFASALKLNIDEAGYNFIDFNPFLLGIEIIDLTTYVILVVLSYNYFNKRKHLFYTPVKQLKEEYKDTIKSNELKFFN